MRFSLFTLFILFLAKATAQKALPATLTLLNGKTLNGSIAHKRWLNTPQEVEFTDQATGKTQIYSTGELRSYSFTRKDGGVEQYEQKTVSIIDRSPSKTPELTFMPKQKAMVRVLLKSTPNLYEYCPEEGNCHFFLERGDTMELLKFKTYTKETLGKPDKAVPNSEFRKQLYKEVSDCKSLTQRFGKLQYEQEAIQSLLEDYFKCQKTPVRYTLTPERIRLNGYVTLGIGLAQQLVPIERVFIEKNDPPLSIIQAGFGVYYHLPGNNQRLGIYSNLSFNYFNTNISGTWGIPAQRLETVYDLVYRGALTNIVVAPRFYLSPVKPLRFYLQGGAYLSFCQFGSTDETTQFFDAGRLIGTQALVTSRSGAVGTGVLVGAGATWRKFQFELSTNSRNPALDTDNSWMWLFTVGYRVF
jgi:hypothetical protein